MKPVLASILIGFGAVICLCTAPAMAVSMCGDANGDGNIDVGDAVYVINYIFKGGPAPEATCCYECVTGETRPCYSGPEGTPGVGECHAGIQTCVDGYWGPCAGEVVPSAEVCDGKDNDCNSLADDNIPGIGGSCNTGLPGVCGAGVWQCQNGVPVCVQNIQPSPEICDGLDNNCDGQIDENDPGGGGPCSTGWQGVCDAGTIHCQNGALVCVQNVQPSPEICDGLDNNCDGLTDECTVCTLPQATSVCQQGTCVIQSCSPGWVNCDGFDANGCEVNFAQAPNSCGTAEYLGEHCGDVGSGTNLLYSRSGSYWYRIYMAECSHQFLDNRNVGIELRLVSPSGADYDVYLYSDYCASLLGGSARPAGQQDIFSKCYTDSYSTDEGNYYMIEVRYSSGNSCDNWNLYIRNCQN